MRSPLDQSLLRMEALTHPLPVHRTQRHNGTLAKVIVGRTLPYAVACSTARTTVIAAVTMLQIRKDSFIGAVMRPRLQPRPRPRPRPPQRLSNSAKRLDALHPASIVTFGWLTIQITTAKC